SHVRLGHPGSGSRFDMAMRYARKLVFSAVTTVAVLMLLEGSSWIGGRVELPDPLITTRKPHWGASRTEDPLLFWRMRPGYHASDGFLINSLGLRGPEIAAKEPGELRILSLGESSTFGSKVSYGETYSAQLERRLAACAGPGRRVRVINAGVIGYSLFQGVTYLEHRGLALEPDVVLLYFGYNDFLKVSYRARRDVYDRTSVSGLTDRQVFRQRRRWLPSLSETLARWSNFYRHLLVLARRGEEPSEVLADDELVRVPETDRRYLLGKALELCRRHGIQLVIVVPWYRHFDRHEGLLREFAAEHRLALVDLPSMLADQPRQKLFVDGVHPNPDGHRLMAEAMAEVLEARLAPAWRIQCRQEPEGLLSSR
ncbi:MAG: SGNH/GDSL hydrolase family protein, partial [Acidobacteria bacterium]|nr:SGNH/GDSL hydrolase family protein [Acidobacteriota bacterium]